ncbi:ABC transporter ATP-binding protein [Streptococcus oralis]|uniref:ABC transporter ATP-binding protein n=1 Tax=Streptococcus oralis TaxID=1303 RepID=UPI0019D2DB2D|nr:ABC transporter ATP-binding protein [Streptococcus oralis]MBN6011031.1 ABC transporter ATP-binding protein [Streptococcus oralis subsp. oralis]
METILRVESLTKHYGKEPNITKALNGISFQVVKGEFLGIMGSSGSGKTTLLNCLATIIKPTDGSIQMQGKDLGQLKGSQLADYRGKEIGYLFQNFELLDNLTAKENILLPLSLHKVDAAESKVRLELLSQYLDISELLDKFPSQLSGGQRQRVAAARALILDPKIVFADEPTGALDSKNATILMQKLSEMNQVEETTILMVTHDSVAASFCNRILFIQDGKLFHEIRRDYPRESQEDFYHRILKVMAALAGGDGNVF